MIISSKQESSVDYPGKFGQILFTSGCNFLCDFCHNPELIFEKNQLDLNKILNDLKIKFESGWYSGVCISGGEPTLHNDLPEFIKKIKKIGLSVKLDTNGSNPDMLLYLLKEKLVDYVAMDIKSPIYLYQDVIGKKVFNIEENIKKSIKIIQQFPDYEFRTTIIPIIRENGKISWMTTAEVENIGKLIYELTGYKYHKYFLQKFIARDKEKMLNQKFSRENLPAEMYETPEELMVEIYEAVKKYLPNCKIRY